MAVLYICCVCCAGDRYFYVYIYIFADIGEEARRRPHPSAVTFYLARRAIFGIYDVLFMFLQTLLNRCACASFLAECAYIGGFRKRRRQGGLVRESLG